MRIFTKISMRLFLSGLWLVAFAAVLSANTASFTLGSDPSQVYFDVNVGPYPGTLSDTVLTQFFCLNLNRTAAWDSTYMGSVSRPSGEPEEEAAFLATYLLSDSSLRSDPNFVNDYAGPVSFAIWQIMGTLGDKPEVPEAQPFVQLATDAYNNNLITTALLDSVAIYTPDDPSIQRFISVDPSVPEPGTFLLLGVGFTGVLLAHRYYSAIPYFLRQKPFQYHSTNKP